MDNKITLYESDYLLTGMCKYKDEYENTLTMRRCIVGDNYENAFTAKLRFADKSIKTNIITVRLPIKDDGITVTFDRPVDERREDIASGLNMLKEIIHRWIDLINSFVMLDMPYELYKKENPYVSESEFEYSKIMNLTRFPEIKDLIFDILGNPTPTFCHI